MGLFPRVNGRLNTGELATQRDADFTRARRRRRRLHCARPRRVRKCADGYTDEYHERHALPFAQTAAKTTAAVPTTPTIATPTATATPATTTSHDGAPLLILAAFTLAKATGRDHQRGPASDLMTTMYLDTVRGDRR